jgi:hypothetical protein
MQWSTARMTLGAALQCGDFPSSEYHRWHRWGYHLQSSFYAMFKLYPRWIKVGHLPTVHSKCQASKLLACFWGAGCTAQKIIVLFPPHGYVPFFIVGYIHFS